MIEGVTKKTVVVTMGTTWTMQTSRTITPKRKIPRSLRPSRSSRGVRPLRKTRLSERCARSLDCTLHSLGARPQDWSAHSPFARSLVPSSGIASRATTVCRNSSSSSPRLIRSLSLRIRLPGDEDGDDESLKLASSAVYNNILLFMLGKADGMCVLELVVVRPLTRSLTLSLTQSRTHPIVRSLARQVPKGAWDVC